MTTKFQFTIRVPMNGRTREFHVFACDMVVTDSGALAFVDSLDRIVFSVREWTEVQREDARVQR